MLTCTPPPTLSLAPSVGPPLTVASVHTEQVLAPHGTPMPPWAHAGLLGDYCIGIFWLSRKTVSYHSPSAPFNTQRLLSATPPPQGTWV